MAYDYNHSLVISYSPTDRGIDGIVAIAARPTGVSLYFSQGPMFAGLSKLVDLKLVGRLELGSGTVAMRYEPRT